LRTFEYRIINRVKLKMFFSSYQELLFLPFSYSIPNHRSLALKLFSQRMASLKRELRSGSSFSTSFFLQFILLIFSPLSIISNVEKRSERKSKQTKRPFSSNRKIGSTIVSEVITIQKNSLSPKFNLSPNLIPLRPPKGRRKYFKRSSSHLFHDGDSNLNKS